MNIDYIAKHRGTERHDDEDYEETNVMARHEVAELHDIDDDMPATQADA